jgi:hypothetical protein
LNSEHNTIIAATKLFSFSSSIVIVGLVINTYNC